MKKESFLRHKEIIISIVFILSSLLIFLEVVVKSVESIGELSQKIKKEEKTLAEYKNSLGVLSSLDSGKISQDFEKVTAALPPTKNLQEIFLAFNGTTLKSGIVLNGFSVKVGEVFEKNSKPKKIEGIPAVSVSVEASIADESTLLAFIEALSNNFPLSKILSINFANGHGVLGIDFYYKPFDLNRINSSVVQRVTEEEKKILKDLGN